MPTYADFSIEKFTDGTLNVAIPGQDLSSWEIRAVFRIRFGGETLLFQKSSNSGGISVTNPGPDSGAIAITISEGDTSGLDIRNYAYSIYRVNAGQVAPCTVGHMILLPQVLR